MSKYIEITGNKGQLIPIKAWVQGVELEEEARQQVVNLTMLDFVYKHLALMPDAHAGKGSTIGSVIATRKAIIPAAVGVDIGCGMIAQKTSLTAEDLPESLAALRAAIEATVPHGRTNNGGRGDRGAWGDIPQDVGYRWDNLLDGWKDIVAKHPKVDSGYVNHVNHLGTLGTGNHFIEICLDENGAVWVMLHSGSRGVGNRIGTYFIDLAKKDMERLGVKLPDQDLAYLKEGSQYFDDYVAAVLWAQRFALTNRRIMLDRVLAVMMNHIKPFTMWDSAIQCHHNYISRETHFGEEVIVTRKGAVRANLGELGIIPGSMGIGSYIVMGKGNPESFNSCSHGAGRKMSRNAAKKRFTVADHIAATEGVECRKDEDVIDETPGAYKSLESVMEAQSDLVQPVYRLKTILCVKG